jgi:hypothetical protein
LLIVTPLQKIHVIEPYVSAVGFVDNPYSNNSRLQTLTIDEYQAGGPRTRSLNRSMSATSSPRPGADVPAARARLGPLADGPGRWTRPADVRAAVRKKWDSGALLARFAVGQDWEPLGIPIRGPSAREIGEHLAEVREWAAEWAAAAARGPLRVEYKQVGGRHFGANSIPATLGWTTTRRSGRCCGWVPRSAAWPG